MLNSNKYRKILERIKQFIQNPNLIINRIKKKFIVDRINNEFDVNLESELYSRWLCKRIELRSERVNIVNEPRLFSLLTGIYEKTSPQLLIETATSILGQSFSGFQWVILKHGSISEELQAVIQEIIKDIRITYIELDNNLGIIGGMQYCLKAATGKYIVPMDADDLLTIDALQCIAQAIVDYNFPAFLYSDEDILVDKQLKHPYFRGDWDPVLNWASSYIWHLCAFLREDAIALGVYTDLQSNWCHDWDTVCRFHNSGVAPIHIPEITYHWRHHANSSTNRPDPESGSLASQRHILELQIAQKPHPDNFEVKLFPIDRGAPEWYIYRKPIEPKNLQVILFTVSAKQSLISIKKILKESNYPFSVFHIVGIEEQDWIQEIKNIKVCFWRNYEHLQQIVSNLDAGLTLVYHSQVQPLGDYWPWETLCLKDFHSDIVLFSGRVINYQNNILAGGEIFGISSVLTPNQGKHKNNPGEYALALKPHSCSAVNSNFFIAEADFLKTAINKIPDQVRFDSLGSWLGAIATLEQKRVVFSPLIAAQAIESCDSNLNRMTEECQELIDRYPSLFPDTRFLAHSSLLWQNERLKSLR